MAKGIDCATPLTAATAAKLAAAGYGFAARYLVPEGDNKEYVWKRLTRAEAEAITGAGLQIVSVFETAANRPAGGAKAGYIDGAAAFREAQAIGQPKGSTIYFAVDYDAQPKDYDAIAAYLQEAGRQIAGYKVGVYGSFAVCEAMIARGAAQCAWQTYAWSRGKKSQVANIYQHQNNVEAVGIRVDLNQSFGNEGWWNTKPIVEPPKPVDQPKQADPYRCMIVVNGKVAADGKLENGRALIYLRMAKAWVPLRDVCDALGATVAWEPGTKTAKVNI